MGDWIEAMEVGSSEEYFGGEARSRVKTITEEWNGQDLRAPRERNQTNRRRSCRCPPRR